jgi:hypothetical protein
MTPYGVILLPGSNQGYFINGNLFSKSTTNLCMVPSATKVYVSVLMTYTIVEPRMNPSRSSNSGPSILLFGPGGVA